MNRETVGKRVAFLGCIVEGMGARAAFRIAGKTGLRLVREVGAGCEAFQCQSSRGLSTTGVEANDGWSFSYSKETNVPAGVPPELRARFGWADTWTWTIAELTG